MKTHTYVLAIIVLLIAPLAVMGQITYTINGRVGQFSEPAKVYLIYNNAGLRQTDSTNITNGVFNFAGTVDQAENAYLIINKNGTGPNSNGSGFISFYLEAGNTSVNSLDFIENAKITGGPLNADNAKLQSALQPINEKIKKLNNEYQSATDEQRKSKEFSDNITKNGIALDQERKKVYLAFIKANPNSLVSFSALKDYAGQVPDVAEVEPAFNLLSTDIRLSKMGVAYAAVIEKLKKTALGAIAPDFTQTDTAGRPISLHDYKGQYVLIDFWASWCGPCRAENPNVAAAYAKYKGKGFNILGISLDQSGEKDKWLKAIHDDHLTWAQVSDLQSWKNEVARLYSVRAIPQNFLIGPDGKIIAKDITGNALNDKLREIFDK